MEKYSYMFGLGKRKTVYATLPTLLDQRARDIPQKAAFIFRYQESDTRLDQEVNGKERISRHVVNFTELAVKSIILAAAFMDIGMKPKDRVIIIGSSCPEFAYVDFACLRASILMIRLPLNLGTLDVLLDALRKHRVTALIIEDYELALKVESAFPGLLGQDQIKYGTNLQHVLLLKPAHSEWRSINDLLEYSGDTDKVMSVQMEQDPDDIAVIFPTSGSTGRPKHVVHSHFSIANGLYDMYERCLMLDNPDSVYLSHHSFSWAGTSPYINILFGITHVQIDAKMLIPSKSAKIFCDIAKQENVTGSFCPAFILFDLMHNAKTEDIPTSLKNIMAGGELIPTDLVDHTKKTFGWISLSYASTEFLMVSSGIQMAGGGQSAESLGWMDVLAGAEVKITDDTGKLVQRKQTGHIQIRSRTSFCRFLDDPVKTRQTKSDSNWLSTGDLGVMNEDGQLKLMGRTHDMISRGGKKVYPATIEQILINNPKVLKVAVVGVPDPRLYQEICAFVILETGADVTATVLKGYVHDQSLRGSMSLVMPKYLIFIDNFPLTHTGKVDRVVLRNSAITQLQLE